jgi:hypothetical protein
VQYKAFEEERSKRKRVRPVTENSGAGCGSDVQEVPSPTQETAAAEEEEPGHHFPHEPLVRHECERARAPKRYRYQKKGIFKTVKAASKRLSKTVQQNTVKKFSEPKRYYYHGKYFDSYVGNTFRIKFEKLWCDACNAYLKPTDMSQHVHGSKKLFLAGQRSKHRTALAKYTKAKSRQIGVVELLTKWAKDPS